MTDQNKWTGQSQAQVLGFKIFVFILNAFGLNPAYFVLRFVSFYYFLFSQPNKYIRQYFIQAHGYSPFKAWMATYKNNFVLGQTIIDKVAVMAGMKNPFKVIHKNGAMLDELTAIGKGGILISAHIGNWEVVGPYLANIAPLTVMYQPLKLPALNQLIFVGRSKLNISLAPTNRKGVCMLLKALQQGTTIGILPDQVPDKGSGAEPINFFGHPAMTMSLVHSLIERTHCRVISVFAKRVKGGFKIIILPAATEIYSENLNESLQGLNLCVEACVRLAPTQYQWEYSRFRSLPLHLREPEN